MAITTQNYSDMTANITVQWAKGFDSVEKAARQIYAVRGTNLLTGAISSLDGFTTAKRKNEGDDFPYLTLTQNYRKTWTNQTIGGMEKITWEMRKYDKYDEISRAFRNLGVGAAKKLEKDLTHRLTYCTATSYTDNGGNAITTTTGDGLALASTVHTVPGSSTTYRSRVANNPVFSKGGLEAAERLLANMIDDNGELSPRTGTHIAVSQQSPNTVNTAMEYLKSVSDPTVSNSGVINVYNGKYQLIILPYLATTASTDAANSSFETYWFLLDLSEENKRGFLYVAEEPKLVPQDSDFETQDWKYATIAAYAIEWLDGKNLIFSSGDGAA